MAHYSQSFVAKYGLSVSAAEDSVTNATYYPLFGTQAVGVLAIKASSTKLSFNPSQGLLSAIAFAGSGAGLTNLNVSAAGSGVLPIARGGSGTGTATGSGDNVLATSPILNSPTINNAALGGTTTASIVTSGTVNTGSLNVTNGAVELGSTSVAGTPFADFHSSGINIDYDARILGSGGNSTAGNGALVYTANGGHTFNGAIYSTGDITAFSDIRLKENLVQITGALDRVLSWKGYTYRHLITGKQSRGVIAQEVAVQAPEYVAEHPETGLLTVAYDKMAADFTEAFREMKAMIDSQSAEIQALKAALAGVK